MPVAAIYVRLSSFRADDTTVAPETQRRACEQWCTENGYEVAAVYEDLDVSGGSLDRPELSKLRRSLRQYDAVVAAKVDRISRSVRDFIELNEQCKSHDVRLVAVRDNLDMGTPIGRFIAVLLAAFAEMEREVIIERTLAGKATARELGRWPGGPVPFGLRNDSGTLVVDDAQAAILREAAELRADGATWRELTRWLSARVPGRKWQPRSVRLVLTNERLRGTIFTAAEYEAVRKLCAPQARADWTPNLSRLLSGMLRCGSCGSKLSAQRRASGSAIYRCTAPTCSHRASVSAALLEPYVEQEYLDAHGERQESRVRPQADVNDERAAELEAELRDIAARLGEADDDDEALRLIGRRREVRAEIGRLRARPRGPLVFVSTGRTMGEAWAATDLDGRRRMLQRALPGGLVVHPAGVPGQRSFNPSRIEPFPLFD